LLPVLNNAGGDGAPPAIKTTGIDVSGGASYGASRLTGLAKRHAHTKTTAARQKRHITVPRLVPVIFM